LKNEFQPSKGRKMLRNSLRFYLTFLFFLVIAGRSYGYLLVEPTNIYLGEVGRDVELKRYIVMQNKGDSELKIVGVINQCGLNLSIPKRVLKKDEITEATLNFFSSTPLGDFKEKLIIVYQEDGATKEAVITVSWKTKGVIFNDISISPKKFDFGKVQLNKPINFYLEMTNKGSIKGSVVTIKRDTGVSFVPNTEISPGETKVFQGSITPTELGKAKKSLTLEIKDFTSPIQEIEFYYEATPDILTGTYLELGEPEKEGTLYKLPVTITANSQSLQLVSVETPDGEKIKISELTPFYVHQGEKKGFYLILDANKYDLLKNSYFYFNIGIKKQ